MSGWPSTAGEATPIERIARPFQVFARFTASGAVLLLAASVAALFWANSRHAGLYESLLHTPVGLHVGAFGLSKSLLHWINDALMGIFFFVVGLEIKREMLAGELSSPRKAALPIFAALGGMLVPAGLFAVLNAGGAGAHGWGIPMATDIAFALGILAVLGDRVPLGLKVFLTALAIVDDLGAIVVIGVFYTEQVSLAILGLGALLLGVSALFNVLGVRSALVYFVIGTLVWLAFLKSGIHATLAAVLMAMTIPARTRIDGRAFLERIEALLERLRRTGVPEGRRLLDEEQQSILQHVEHSIDQATAPLQQLEHALMPTVTFLVLPIFALANAGVATSAGFVESLRNPVCLGIIVGLFAGKQAGVLGFAWLATRTGLAALPQGVTWRQIHAAGVLAGIGFTMALFIGGLAYQDAELQNVAKVGILSASLLSSIVGAFLLRRALPRDP